MSYEMPLPGDYAEAVVTVADLDALMVSLMLQPELVAKKDELGNWQAVFKLFPAGQPQDVTVVYPASVPASVIATAVAGIPAIVATRAAAVAAAGVATGNIGTIHDRLRTGLQTADTHIANLQGTPTAVQQKNALIFALNGVKQLARLELHELTSAD